MAGDEAKQPESPVVEKTTAEQSSPASSEKTGSTLTRKRTRDDFDEDEKAETEKEDRKIAPLKRRKSVTEDSTEKPKTDTLKKDETIAEASKESTAEPSVKSEETTETAPDSTKSENKTAEEEESEEVKSENPTESEAPVESVSERASEVSVKENEDTSKESMETKPAPSKFVFGATTPFGANAFSMLNKKKNVFDSEQKSASTAASNTSSVFGSGLSFGNAFQTAISKKSIFDQKKEEKEDSPAAGDSDSTLGNSTATHMYKQVDLEKTEVKSGEEDEEQLFTCRAKLYALDLTNVKDGWKERGVGNVRVNKSKDAERASRIIMRSNGLLKVILNTALVKGLEIVKGMPSSMSPEKFIRITSVEDKKPVQYAIKTGNVETADTLYTTITELINTKES